MVKTKPTKHKEENTFKVSNINLLYMSVVKLLTVNVLLSRFYVRMALAQTDTSEALNAFILKWFWLYWIVGVLVSCQKFP